MRTFYTYFLFLITLMSVSAQHFQVSDAIPAYVDSIWYGSADPTVMWNPVKKEFYMYYTQRRATIEGNDWPEGSNIGIAASKDGRQWRYIGICRGERLENPVEDDYSLWAPSVIYHKKKFHIYVTYVPGITGKFGKGIRYIKHYTSKDGEQWDFESILHLSSDACIDPCVYKVGKIWQMIYKDETHGSFTWVAESKDLYEWKVQGPIIEDMRHEAPFYWKQNGRHFIIVDAWKNLSRVYESPNGLDGWEYITSFEAGHPAILQANGKTFLIYHKHEINFPRGTGIFIDELIMGEDGKPQPLYRK